MDVDFPAQNREAARATLKGPMIARFVAAALLFSSSAQASILYTTSYYGDFAAIDLSTLRTQARGALGVPYDWGGLAGTPPPARCSWRLGAGTRPSTWST